jgi:hypothetical protein
MCDGIFFVKDSLSRQRRTPPAQALDATPFAHFRADAVFSIGS